MQFNITPTVKNLLFANFGVYVLAIFINSIYGIDINDFLGLHSYFSERFQPYQFITYIFMHAHSQNGHIVFAHIFSNMFALFIFGPMLENRWGGKRFLFFYLFTGVGAGLSYWGVNAYEVYHLKQAVTAYLQHPGPAEFVKFVSGYDRAIYRSWLPQIEEFSEYPTDPNAIAWSKAKAMELYNYASAFSMVGASGSVYGVLMAFGLLFPNTIFQSLFIPIPIKAKYIVAFYGISALYMQIKSAPDDNVAHFAHLAGMLFAFILVRYWNKRRDVFY
jgi:membrane associated rhomboid family serine protease